MLPPRCWSPESSSCRCDPHRPRRAGAARTAQHRVAGAGIVAILTGPGKPALFQLATDCRARCWWLRSSPTSEGRCRARTRWPPPGRRLAGCDRLRPWRTSAVSGPKASAGGHLGVLRDLAVAVAILTDPGGPVLVVNGDVTDGGVGVAIHTDPGGPVLTSLRAGSTTR